MRLRVFGQYINAPALCLAFMEGVIFIGAFYAAFALRFGLLALQSVETHQFARAFVFCVALLASFMAFGLYSGRLRARFIELALRVVVAAVSGTAVVATVFYMVPYLYIGRGVLLIGIALAIAGSFVARFAFHTVVDEGMFKRRVLVYGAGKRAFLLTRLRRRAERRGFDLVGFLQAEGEECSVPAEALVERQGTLIHLCRRLCIDEIILAMDDRRRAFPMDELLACRVAGIDIIELTSFLERETSKLRLDVMNPSWLIFGPGFRRSVVRLASSRTLDLIASALLLAFALPLMLLAALAIKLEDGWHSAVFYRQKRVGLHGKVFDLLKFRSMRADAEGDGVARWAVKDDIRVTRVGALMRNTRLDELPQLLNVLVGQMSLVGPRPERPQFVCQLSAKIPYYSERHSVRPGITGWAQLCYPYGATEHDALQKLEYDLYYIKHNNLLFDVAILVQTVEIVCFGRGAR